MGKALKTLVTFVAVAWVLPASAQTPDPNRAQTEIRLMEMENQLRKVTGQYEEATYRLTQLNRRLESALEDMQFRMDQLEQQVAAGGGAAIPENQADAEAVTSPTTSSAVPVDPVDAGSGANEQAGLEQAGNGPVGGLLGETPPSQALPKTPEDNPDEFLEGATPEQQFEAAFAHLRRNELETAEKSFRAFLTAHPESSLAPNAKYWLGKTYYARSDYDGAARVFLEGFEQFSQTDKGPDTLLHLALSLNNIGQQQQACAAFDELSNRYPDAAATIQQRAATGRQAAGCT